MHSQVHLDMVHKLTPEAMAGYVEAYRRRVRAVGGGGATHEAPIPVHSVLRAPCTTTLIS